MFVFRVTALAACFIPGLDVATVVPTIVTEGLFLIKVLAVFLSNVAPADDVAFVVVLADGLLLVPTASAMSCWDTTRSLVFEVRLLSSFATLGVMIVLFFSGDIGTIGEERGARKRIESYKRDGDIL